MRFSYLGIGVFGTTAYAFGILIPGIIFMSKDGNSSDAARKALDDATANYTAANSAYLANEARLVDAQGRISDANCYVNQYPGLVTQLGNFCFSAATYTNAINTLNQNYKVQVITQPPTTNTNSFQDYEYYYVKVKKCGKVKTCTKDSNGKNVCTEKEECHDENERRTHYFTVIQNTYSNYGTLIVGDGKNLDMGCSQYDHSIAVSTSTCQKATTGMNLDVYTYDVRTYRETKTFSSAIKVDIKVDNQVRTSRNEIPTATIPANFMQIAAQVLDQIDRQCKALNSSLKNPEFYVDLIVTISETLPGIRADIESSKQYRDQMAAFRDSKQVAFNSVDAVYRQTLLTWLLSFFLPTAFFIFLLCKFNEALSEKYVDTQDCCKPSIKAAIPVAMPVYMFRSRRNNSRTNIEQSDAAEPVWHEAEPDGIAQAIEVNEATNNVAEEEVAGVTVVSPPPMPSAPPMTFSNFGANISPFSSKGYNPDNDIHDDEELKKDKSSNALTYV